MTNQNFRINQFLAKSLNISRRQADQIIKAGQVNINSSLAKLNDRVGCTDKVVLNQKGLQTTLNTDFFTKKDLVLLFYKPVFSLVSTKGEANKKTIYDFLPKIYHNLKPAGRLDYMSEGLLVLTTDGELLYQLTHPKFEHPKKYLVKLSKPLTKAQIKTASTQMIVSKHSDVYKPDKIDTKVRLRPVKIYPADQKILAQYSFLNLLDQKKARSSQYWYIFELMEGRNNQIRKMVNFFDSKVVRLIRIQHQDFELTKKLCQDKYLLVDHNSQIHAN
jgi:pseudouridine synthase